MSSVLALVPGRSAEEAVRAAAASEGVAGVVVGGDLLAGPGPAVIAALAATHAVLVLAGLHGDATRAATAARRYAEYGATWVTAQAADGPALVEAAAATGVRVVAVTLRHGQGDAEAASIGGRSRGKAVSRLAEAAVRVGAKGVLCDVPDLGVVAQVAPGAARFVWAGGPADAVAAATRGAEYVIVDAAAVAETTAAIAGTG
jgi:hypothetical protein